MGRARHLRRLAAAGALLVLTAALTAAGCGSSASEGSTNGSTSSGEGVAGRRLPAGATTYSCVSSAHGVGNLRSTGVICADATAVADAWSAEHGCALTPSASRGACTVGRYRCLATASEHGLAVSCSRPGRSVSFVARR